MGTVKYYTFSSESAGTASNLEGPISDVDQENPLFNFSPDFFEKLQSISSPELAQSIPFVSLHTVDLNGEIIDDLNVNFLHKTADIGTLNQGIRYSDRPTMSLKSLQIKTTLASGYLYYTDVVLSLKIHAPHFLTQATITSLVFPGMPHLLEYGWHSPNEFLNQKERLLFQVVTYDLNFDETGQIDLTVRGKALNDNFNNALVGDGGGLVSSDTIKNEESDSINHQLKKLDEYIKYLKDTKQNSGQQANEYKLLKIQAENYKNREKKARRTVSKKFRENKIKLKKLSKQGSVRLQDLIYTLCDGTFGALTDTWPRVSEFRFIYGDINESIRNDNIPTSLADFPIQLTKFNSIIRDATQKGEFVITINRLLNILAEDFIENEDVWKKGLDPKRQKAYNEPEIVINFSNRGGSNDSGVMEVTFVDVKNGIPVTISKLPPENASGEIKAAEADVEAAITENNLPILRIGHANSFVKNLKLSQITDQAMKSVLIERMSRDRAITPRSTKVQSKGIDSPGVTPLTLPLKGNITVLGHPEWRPFRALFLSSGIFLVDGVYKIMGVTHTLKSGQFDTNLDLMYN